MDVLGLAYNFDIDPGNLNSASKERPVTEARRVLCYIAVRKLGYKCTEVSKALTTSVRLR
jgi:chromosomal replication initiation ATPase DnaA